MLITSLIPQRDPILMVDALCRATAEEGETTFEVKADCVFLDDDARLDEAGLVEHIAQSASALAGYRAREAGTTTAPVGFIGEVKKFRLHRRPAVGELLRTTVQMGVEVDGVTLLTGQTRVGDELVAETQMKIFIEHTKEAAQ